MKQLLRSALLIALPLVALIGCEPTPECGLGAPGPCPPEEAPFVSGNERILLVNGKLSSKSDNYTLNEKDASGRWLGSELVLYDPANKGQVKRLGRFDFGPDDPEGDFDFQQMNVREIAWHRTLGLFGIFIDPVNDEWLLGKIAVPGFNAEGQRLPVTLHAFRGSDLAVYELEEISGLGFFGDALLVGTPAPAATAPGKVLELAVGALAFENEANPYYLASNVSQERVTLPQTFGVAGDLAEVGGMAYGLVRKANDVLKHSIARIGATVEVRAQVFQADPNDGVDGLAEVNGALFAVTLEGKILRVDPESGAMSEHDDLGPAFPKDELGQSTRRLRGAAGVEL